MTSKQKWPVFGLIVLLLVAGGLAAALRWHKAGGPGSKGAQNPQTQPASNAATTTPQVTVMDDNKIPDALPAGLPWEKNAQVLQNFNLYNPQTGQNQVTRAYVTKKTMQQNYDSFKSYLTAGNWNIYYTSDSPAIKSIYGSQGMNTLQINITHEDTPVSQDIVNVTYFYAVPKPQPTVPGPGKF